MQLHKFRLLPALLSMTMTSITRVFVYGTLKPGEVNHKICEGYVVDSQPAIAQGKLYHLPFGYPAMTLTGTDAIHGFILSFVDVEILNILDEFEQHEPEVFTRFAPEQSLAANQYQRELIKVSIPKSSSVETAWGYVMTSEQIRRLSGIPVANGHWSQHNL